MLFVINLNVIWCLGMNNVCMIKYRAKALFFLVVVLFSLFNFFIIKNRILKKRLSILP